jgi:hypothetical protein
MNSAAITELVAVMNRSGTAELAAMPSAPAPVAPVSRAPAQAALPSAPVAPAPARVVLAPSSIISAPVPVWDRPAVDATLASLGRVSAAPAPIAAKPPMAAKPAVADKAPAQVVAKAQAIDSRRPYHLGVAIGLSAGVYASSLAVVSILQIEQDGHVAADRRPVGDAISILGVHNDAMESDLQAARSVFDEASVRYGSVVSDIGELHVAVKQLGKTIVRIEGTSTDFRLPSMVSLPSVPQGTASRPSSASKPGSASKPAAKPPPSNGGTGASGKP